MVLLLIFFILIPSTSQFIVTPSNVTKLDEDGKSSLVFVFDTTGSMYNDLRQLRAGAEMILKTALEESNVIADFVFVPFHDPAIGPATVTKDKEVFKSALQIVRVYGGGDCPEKSLGGILLALNVSRPRSYVYVFTDATASDYRLVNKVLDAVQRKQSQVVFVLTGHCNDLQKPTFKVYQQIAAASSGQVFNLNKTSVHKVLDFVRSSIKGRSVNLASAVNPAGYNHTQKIPVDSTVNEVTVSVSGAKPQIRVVNPSGEELTGPPQLVTTLDLSEIMIVKVLNPEPGNWSITVGSTEEHSVKVVGMSNLTFNHGFSVLPPSSMADTSYRPLQGTYNHMLISLTKTDIPVEVKFAEILNLEGRTLFEVPLKVLNSTAKLYVAEVFVPPDELFYVSINGLDENGRDLRRVGATAVQVKSPDAPYLVVPQKIAARVHERVVLTCKVESLVPLVAGWVKDEQKLQPKTSSLQSTTVQYVVEDMTESHVGSYQCVATNVAGLSTAKTVLDLIVEPPQVSVLPVNATIPVANNLNLTCSVFSEALLHKSLIIFNGTNRNYAITFNLEHNFDGVYTLTKTIENVTENDQGLYTCVAGNRGGTTNTSTYIHIQPRPLAHILGPHTLTRRARTQAQFVCCVENASEMYWLDPAGGELGRVGVEGSLNAVLDVGGERGARGEGVWTCVAVRDNFTASDSIELHVLIKPEVKIEGSRNITVLNGTVVQVTCTVVAKPTPRILWHMETERFLDNNITTTSPNVYTSVLTLDSTKEPINGTYFCFGENSEGIEQDSITVQVRRKMVLLEGPSDRSVELYSKVELSCRVDAYPPPQVSWYHNNTQLTPDSTKVDGSSTIHIDKVDFDDLGLYSCVANNSYEVLEVNASLTVNGLEGPVLSKELVRKVTHKGTSISLTCRLLRGKPEPTISWHYQSNNSSNFTNLPSDVIIDKTELHLSNVSVDKEGIYRCTAQNVLGKDENDIKVVVQYPPELSNSENISTETMKIKLGEKVKFHCNVTGNPPPVVVWTKDYQPIAFSKNIYLSENNELIIDNITQYDDGVFTCEAVNPLGSIHRNFTLNVFKAPEIYSTIDHQKEVLEGQLVELPCFARGIPPPTVKWLHNGSPMTERRKYIDEYGLRFVANLTDFGEYSCVASNEHGVDTFIYTLYVWVAPSIESPLEVIVKTLQSSNMTFTCDVIGFPVPEILWEFNGQLLQENTTDISFNSIGNLYLNNVSSHSEGEYMCVAENIAGVVIKRFFVNVEEPPKFDSDNLGEYIGIADRDLSMTLTCRATGKPRPYILWIKDGFYLDRDSRYEVDNEGSLTIKRPAVELSGNYTCVAKNSLGNVSRTVQVHIYPLPARIQSDEAHTAVSLVEGTEGAVGCPVRHAEYVKWYKDAILIANDTLKFPNVSRSHAGAYACVVSNVVGSTHAVVTVNVLWPPSFVNHPVYDIQVVKGDDYYLDCEADASPRAKTKWLFNSKLMLGEDRDKLKLMNTQIYHSGVYKCVVTNEYGTVDRTFTLDVFVPPYISEFDFLDVQLKEGSNATLECNAKGYPKPYIKWIYNNTDWNVKNSSLSSTNISMQSEGIFRCNATNKAGVAHVVYNVTVASAARIKNVVLFLGGEGSNVDKSVDIALNSNVRIACIASGYPIPTVQWLRNGNKISQNSRDVSYADMTFANVATSHAGVYSCAVTNEGGLDERNIRINVLEPPRIFGTLSQDKNNTGNTINMDVLSEQTFYMHCHAYGNPMPEIYWFKKGLPLKLYDDTMVSKEFGEVIEVHRAIEEHSGNYTCVARNSVGESSLVYLVDVFVAPPQPKDNTKHITTRIGDPLNLHCPALGRPLPYVTWVRHPYTEIGPTDRIHLTSDNYTLTINNTEILDTGKYSCIMTNKVGSTEIIFDVVIENPPSIAANVGNNSSEKHVVALGRSIVLKCESNGNPTPKITWLKDIQKLNENLPNIQNLLGTSLLAMWSVRTRDAGQYICIAENEAGSAHRRYDLIVQVPGKWSAWSNWGYCNVTCGGGHQRRTRVCQYLDDDNTTYDKSTETNKIMLDDSACKGSTEDKRKCHMPPCEEEITQSHWSRWSRWSACSASCGAGTQTRSRRCRGLACSGDNLQIRKCPGLPRCYSSRERLNNNVYTSADIENESKLDYLPEATFEMQPQLSSRSSTPADYDDIYTSVPKASPYYEVNVTENLDQSERGPCAAGYWHNMVDNSCIDIDECALDSNHCHATQVCSNSPGGYRCSCPRGFVSLGAGQRCLVSGEGFTIPKDGGHYICASETHYIHAGMTETDINECEQNTARCEFACVNTAGGYVCACPRHLRLHSDRHRCVSPSEYNKPHSYEDFGVDDYLTTSIEFPPTTYTKRSRV